MQAAERIINVKNISEGMEYFLVADGFVKFFKSIGEMELAGTEDIDTYVNKDSTYHDDVFQIVGGMITHRVFRKSRPVFMQDKVLAELRETSHRNRYILKEILKGLYRYQPSNDTEQSDMLLLISMIKKYLDGGNLHEYISITL